MRCDGDSDVYVHVHACAHLYVDAHASAQQGFGGLLLALVAWRRKASMGLCSRSCRSAAPLRMATSASCRMIFNNINVVVVVIGVDTHTRLYGSLTLKF